jgi:hypothetical protein
MNAHTRRRINSDDVIVEGQMGKSGRLLQCIPIGEYRDKSYRVRKDLLKVWGGISVKDGYIQRSAMPPTLKNPTKFMRWFKHQKPFLIERNNLILT